jgi:hypothetical protein
MRRGRDAQRKNLPEAAFGISILDPSSGERRTLLDGLPSAINNLGGFPCAFVGRYSQDFPNYVSRNTIMIMPVFFFAAVISVNRSACLNADTFSHGNWTRYCWHTAAFPNREGMIRMLIIH